MKVLLISEKEIKNQSIIEQNIDSKVLSKIIDNIQETQLKPILGEVLYNSVLDGVYQLGINSIALTTDMLELLETYIIPFLVNATMVDFIVVNNYKISSKGTLKLNDSQAASVSFQEIEYAKNYYDNYTLRYKENLIKYLSENNLSIAGTDTDIITPSIGWYLESEYDECKI